jgi:hypothetical protein
MSDFLARVDATLADLGLQGVPWLLHGRKLHGTLDGRTVSGHLSIRSSSSGGTGRWRYAGHHLELAVTTPLAARLVVFQPSMLRLLVARTNRWFGLRELRPPPALTHLRVWTADADWGARLLADPEAAATIAALLPAGGPASAGLQHSPGKWLLATRDHGERVLAALPTSLDALLRLAERAEALPAPPRPYQPNWPERHPRAMQWLLLLGCPATFVLLGILFAAALIALSFLLSAMQR